MRVKATFAFALNQFGWSESMWTEIGSSDLEEGYNKAKALAMERKELLGKQAILKAIRVSDESVKNDAILRYVDYTASEVEHESPEKKLPSCDEPDAAILVVCRSLDGKAKKHVFLRGIWDDVDIMGGKFDKANAEYWKRFQSWKNTYIKGQWGWPGIDPALKKNAIITNYAQDDLGRVTFVLVGAPFVGVPAQSTVQVRISKLNGSSVLNGQQLVTVLSDVSCRTVAGVGVKPFSSDGKLTYNTSKFYATVTMDLQKIVTRRVGAPLLESAGRQRRRAKG